MVVVIKNKRIITGFSPKISLKNSFTPQNLANNILTMVKKENALKARSDAGFRASEPSKKEEKSAKKQVSGFLSP